MKRIDAKNLIIVSGPSGAGQDTIIERLTKIMPIERVITTTTRPMRPGESQKNPYYFISETKFKQSVKNKEFFEYAKEYNDNYYGVTYREISRAAKSGRIAIWKIEYQGVITAKKLIPGIKAIMVNAPLKILEQRMRKRNPEYSDEFIRERMAYTREWLKHKKIYDYVVKNEEGKLDEAVVKVKKIIEKTAVADH